MFDTCGLIFFSILYILPIGAVDTCFKFICPSGLRIPAFFLFFLLAHRGLDTCWYTNPPFSGPSGQWIPAFFFFFFNYVCVCLFVLAHRGPGYLLYYFFHCPSGPRIPALIFFFLPIGALDTCFNFFDFL